MSVAPLGSSARLSWAKKISPTSPSASDGITCSMTISLISQAINSRKPWSAKKNKSSGRIWPSHKSAQTTTVGTCVVSRWETHKPTDWRCQQSSSTHFRSRQAETESSWTLTSWRRVLHSSPFCCFFFCFTHIRRGENISSASMRTRWRFSTWRQKISRQHHQSLQRWRNLAQVDIALVMMTRKLWSTSSKLQRIFDLQIIVRLYGCWISFFGCDKS